MNDRERFDLSAWPARSGATTSIRRTKSLRRCASGTMGINNYFGGDITVPFGGFKQSGNGRDKSIHAFHDYTELKTTWIEFE